MRVAAAFDEEALDAEEHDHVISADVGLAIVDTRLCAKRPGRNRARLVDSGSHLYGVKETRPIMSTLTRLVPVALCSLLATACAAQSDDTPSAEETAATQEDGLTANPFAATCTGSIVTHAQFLAGKGSQLNLAAIYRFGSTALQTRSRASASAPWGLRHVANFQLPGSAATKPVLLSLILDDDDAPEEFDVGGAENVFYNHDTVRLEGAPSTSTPSGTIVANAPGSSVVTPIAENLKFTVGAGCAQVRGRSSNGLREWAASWSWTKLPKPQLVLPPFGGGG